VTRVSLQGMRMEYAIRGEFCGFGPQKPSGGSEKRTARGSIKELASRLSYLTKGVVAVGSWLSRVELECLRG